MLKSKIKMTRACFLGAKQEYVTRFEPVENKEKKLDLVYYIFENKIEQPTLTRGKNVTTTTNEQNLKETIFSNILPLSSQPPSSALPHL